MIILSILPGLFPSRQTDISKRSLHACSTSFATPCSRHLNEWCCAQVPRTKPSKSPKQSKTTSHTLPVMHRSNSFGCFHSPLRHGFHVLAEYWEPSIRWRNRFEDPSKHREEPFFRNQQHVFRSNGNRDLKRAKNSAPPDHHVSSRERP